MIWRWKSWIIAGILTNGLVLAAAPAQGAAAETTATAVPASIPVGPADENIETSRAITAILDNCARAYPAIGAMHAAGQYVAINKSEDEPTTYVTSRVRLDFLRPGKLAVHSESDSPDLQCDFVANGTTVTMAWADKHGAKPKHHFFKMPQPESLAAYTENHRAGEVYDERSGALAVASFSQILVADDPRGILYDLITRFIYEGREEVAGHECHRLRFIQEMPEAVVILWIDAETYLIRKTSFIYSYDADYNLQDSFEEGVDASMMVINWDEITTDPAKVNPDAFKWKLPKGSRRIKLPMTTTNRKKEAPSLWESLVLSAAKSSDTATTYSLSHEQGEVNMTLSEVANFPRQPFEMVSTRLPGETTESLLVVSDNGDLSFLAYDGSGRTTTSLGRKMTRFDVLENSAGELMQYLTLNPDSTELSAWNLDRTKAWSYNYLYEKINTFVGASSDPYVYLALGGSGGVRKLNSRGEVEFANAIGTAADLITPMPVGVDRVAVRSLFLVRMFDKQLNYLRRVESDERLASTRWDVNDPAHPLITIAATGEKDLLVQRRTESGDVVWTVTLAPKLTKAQSAGLVWVNFRIGGEVRKCLYAGVSTGHIVLLSPDGKVLYRGRLTVDPATVERNGGNVTGNQDVGDLNGDGLDEIYLMVDTHLLRMESAPLENGH